MKHNFNIKRFKNMTKGLLLLATIFLMAVTMHGTFADDTLKLMSPGRLSVVKSTSDQPVNHDIIQRSGSPIFEFTKIDGDSQEPLAGVEFDLYLCENEDTCEEWIANSVSANNGHVGFYDNNGDPIGLIPGGRYRLIEMDAPAGFAVAAGDWIIDVSVSGVISITESDEQQPAFERRQLCTPVDVNETIQGLSIAVRGQEEPGIVGEEALVSIIVTNPNRFALRSTEIAFGWGVLGELTGATLIPGSVTVNGQPKEMLVETSDSFLVALGEILAPGETIVDFYSTLTDPDGVHYFAALFGAIVMEPYGETCEYEWYLANEPEDGFIFEFFKTDESIYDYSDGFEIENVLRLDDAVFTLERCTSTPEAGTCANDEWELIEEAISGQRRPGHVQFRRLEDNTLYRLTEIESPTEPRLFKRPDGYWYIRLDEFGDMVAEYPISIGELVPDFRQYPLIDGEWFVGAIDEGKRG